MKKVTFRDLHQFSKFQYKGRTYVKVYDGQAVDAETGKDIIPGLGERVIPKGKVLIRNI